MTTNDEFHWTRDAQPEVEAGPERLDHHNAEAAEPLNRTLEQLDRHLSDGAGAATDGSLWHQLGHLFTSMGQSVESWLSRLTGHHAADVSENDPDVQKMMQQLEMQQGEIEEMKGLSQSWQQTGQELLSRQQQEETQVGQLNQEVSALNSELAVARARIAQLSEQTQTGGASIQTGEVADQPDAPDDPTPADPSDQPQVSITEQPQTSTDVPPVTPQTTDQPAPDDPRSTDAPQATDQPTDTPQTTDAPPTTDAPSESGDVEQTVGSFGEADNAPYVISQGNNDLGETSTCGVASQVMMLNKLEGKAANDPTAYTENQLLHEAVNQGWYDHGTALEDFGKLLEEHGHHVERGNSSLEELVSRLAQGQEAQVSVNAGILWQDPSSYGQGEHNHAVFVSGADVIRHANGQEELVSVWVDDSGTGQAYAVSAQQFEQAWAASQNYAAYASA